MAEMFHTLTMGGGPHAKGVEVWLDGMKLKGVTGIEVRCDVTDVVRVTLELITKIESKMLISDWEMPSAEELPEHMKKIHADLMKLKEPT